MSKHELQNLVERLSAQEKRELRALLDTEPSAQLPIATTEGEIWLQELLHSVHEFWEKEGPRPDIPENWAERFDFYKQNSSSEEK